MQRNIKEGQVIGGLFLVGCYEVIFCLVWCDVRAELVRECGGGISGDVSSLHGVVLFIYLFFL